MYRTARRASGAIALGLATGAVAAPAATADTTYPTPGGSTFTSGGDGWQDAGKACATLLGTLPNLLCEVDSGVSATAGVPAGSLRQDFTPAVGLLGPVLTEGTVAQRSPSFTVAGYPSVTAATLTYDRRLDNDALIDIMPGVTSQVTLVDETVPGVRNAGGADILGMTYDFHRRQVDIPADRFVAGHSYHLVITTSFSPTLQALLGKSTARYDNVSLSVRDGSVAPTATTLPATNVTALGAALNGSVTTGGAPAKTHFEYGPTDRYGQSTPERDAVTDGPVAAEPIGGLAPSTTYHFRLFVTGADGTDVAGTPDLTFTTPAVPQGAPGTNGTNGSDGANGTNGAAGATGPSGSTGAPGPAGAKDPAGPSGVSGSSMGGNTVIIQNGSNKSLLKIRASDITVVTAGRLKGQVRLPIFCSARTGRACAGTVKIRTIAEINPASRPPARAKRRVTLTTFEYQLVQGRAGFAFAFLSPDKLDLMNRLKRIGVSITVQVTDAQGNRQIVTGKGRLVTRRTA
ncbi:MAG: Fibronectin type domain protein [Solirubrobacterales bacterium]|nr:Fibronectin type domain protein [Solirubrobacterales bacterium]